MRISGRHEKTPANFVRTELQRYPRTVAIKKQSPRISILESQPRICGKRFKSGNSGESVIDAKISTKMLVGPPVLLLRLCSFATRVPLLPSPLCTCSLQRTHAASTTTLGQLFRFITSRKGTFPFGLLRAWRPTAIGIQRTQTPAASSLCSRCPLSSANVTGCYRMRGQ